MKAKPEIIQEFGVKPEIDVQEEIERRIKFLADYLKENPVLNGYIIGISGGVDSAVAAALTQLACDRVGKRAIGMFTPYYEEPDIDDAYAVAEAIGMETIEVNIGPVVDLAARHLGDKPNKMRLGNRKARQRMIEWYDVAQKYGLAVVGTDHAAEAIVGYYTKYGDGGVDILPLKTLDKRQIVQLARAEWPFGRLPRVVWEKAPTAGLWEGQTDEAELGVSYDAICDYLQGKDVSPEAARRIEELYRKSWHKRHMPFI